MGQYYKPIILKQRNEVVSDNPDLGYYPEQIDRWWLSHDFDNGLKLMEHSWIGNNFVAEVEHYLINNPQRLVWAGDYADEESDGETLYSKCEDDAKMNHEEDFDMNDLNGIFVVNHSKKQFYARLRYNPDEWTVNPLPLLTSEGNGRGGGDYHKEDSMVGMWARDIIEYSKEEPGDGYEEIFPNFKEGW